MSDAPERVVDLRSDTVTRPTPAMRRAIAEAEVGDDVFGDDPTVHALERRVAELLGHEAALFVPSGTMANQIAVQVHTHHGDEILVEENAHVVLYEAGAPAALAGVQVWRLPGDRGLVGADAMRAAVRPEDPHYPRTRLFCLENTHNRAGGRVLPLDEVQRLVDLARDLGLCTHLDGARLWNAAAATGRSEKDYASLFHTVSVCFSKGLGAPVGSALAGSQATITEARRIRKRLGGGMRQAGILAAGALHGVEHHRARLIEDHERARRLARGLDERVGLCCPQDRVETNIVVVDVEDAGATTDWLRSFEEAGVRAVPFGAGRIRFVTHLDVDDEDIDFTIDVAHRIALARG